MFKTVTAFIICCAFAAPLQAANVITFGGDQMVVFPHQQHQKNLGGCTDCHGSKEPGRFPEFGEKWAHSTCMGCHSESKSGPVECGGCHSNI